MKEKKTSFGTWNRFGIIVVLFCLSFAPFVRAQQSWHLSGDWSDASNPNGPWSYNKMPGVPIVGHQSDWDSLDVVFTTAQPAWAEAQLPATGHVPAWFKVVSGTDPEIDLPLGVVGMHGSADPFSPAGVVWLA